MDFALSCGLSQRGNAESRIILLFAQGSLCIVCGQFLQKEVGGVVEHPRAMLIRPPSFSPGHSFFLSRRLRAPPFLPSTIARAARSLLHSLALAPLALPGSFLSCFLPPSPPFFFFQSSLDPSLNPPPNPPLGRRSTQCQERKKEGRAKGRVGCWPAERLVMEIEAQPLVKLERGVRRGRKKR